MVEEEPENQELFINRELSWIEFNRRVLEEAKGEHHPLLERIKFLSIFSSNLDEFMMIRVSGLRRQIKGGVLESPPDGLTPTEQITEIRKEVKLLIREADEVWRESIIEALESNQIYIHKYRDLSKKQKGCMREYFETEVFPVLTPMSFDVGRPFPFISNLSLNLAVIINDPESGMIFSRVKVPRDAFKRLVKIPPDDSHCHGLEKGGKDYNFIFIEDLIASNVDLLFPGMDIVNCYPFVVTRDTDLEIEEDEASDLLTAIEESIGLRRTGSPTRLEVNRSMPKWVRVILAQKLSLSSTDVYTNDDPLRKSDLMELMDIDRPDLKDKPYLPFYPCGFEDDKKNMFQAVKNGDILFYHPYDSFNPIINLLKQAAYDPDVIAIKQTLYRVGKNSPVVKYLMKARENGKQVSVMVELKARFDEENNIEWAKKLEQAGVHVVYGIVGIKVHAKFCMIVRHEKEGLITYVHFGTGNYNPVTSRVYTDFGIITCDKIISSDAANLFNALTGHSGKVKYGSLLVSYGKNGTMREEILRYINEEINQHNINGNGYIAFKMNQLVDPDIIKALYFASKCGVKIDLQVR
ncbi:MAG: polyphosphate kinase 1, partial [Methanomicrobium sp.]|nr:polyphosphate kinase 1 [Methanomicrobium sp.]